jgi:TonB family protein
MYVPYREDTQVQFKLKIPWDKFTARGFAIALAIVFLLISFISISFSDSDTHEIEQNLIPVEMINFGNGDGTGVSKGNLSREGASHKGAITLSDLHDAKIAATKRAALREPVEDPENYRNLKGIDGASTNEKNKNSQDGNSTKNIGSPDGSPQGTGTGTDGFGPGAGLGLGDIEWGGGGNRVVLFKKLPEYPPGVNTEAQIRIRFTVRADGTVSTVFPLQKGDPLLEKAAMDAMRKWRFNPLKDDKEMYGIITFTFRLS